MSEWRPIAEVPKDGRLILFTNQKNVTLGRWVVIARRDTLNDGFDDLGPFANFTSEYGWRFASDKAWTIDTFTHWMAVPAPPPLTQGSN